VRDRWVFIKSRASKCLGLIEDPNVRSVQQAGLQSEPEPTFGGGASRSRLGSVLSNINPSLRPLVGNNLIERSNLLAPSVMRGVRAELHEAFRGDSWRDYLREVHLSVDVAGNRHFEIKIRSVLAELDACFARPGPRIGLCGGMQGTFLANGRLVEGRDRQPSLTPSVTIAAADHLGRIVRFLEIGHNSLYFGSPHARPSSDARVYDPRRELRSIGSVGKILAAIALVATDDNELQQELSYPLTGSCPRECRQSVLVASCQCRLDAVIGKSLNRPLIDYLTHKADTGTINYDSIKSVVRKLGMNPDAHTAVPVPTRIVFGMTGSSPQTIHRLVGAIQNSTTGKAVAALPTLISHCKGETDRLIQPLNTTRRTNLDLGDIISSASSKRIASVFESPLCYKDATAAAGTLSRLHGWCSTANSYVRNHFAKSGSHSTKAQTLDLWAAGGIAFNNGASYSYVVAIGDGDNGQAWGRGFNAGELLTPIVSNLLADLQALSPKSSPTVERPLGPVGCR
jgi:hypothetical protein